jgi:hypothetical protein
VLFERLITSRQYVAVIDAYDRPPCGVGEDANCITALGSVDDGHRIVNSGSRIMVERPTNAYIPPRWQTSCGEEISSPPRLTDAGADAHAPRIRLIDASVPLSPEAGQTTIPYGYACVVDKSLDGGFIAPFLGGPVCVVTDVPITITGCVPLGSTSNATSQTGVSVDLADALAGLTCGSASGQVQSFSVTVDGQSSAAKSAACGSSVVYDDLTPGTGYTFHVTATSASTSTKDGGTDASASDAGSQTWTTTCYREAVAGVVVRAGCDPLQSAAAR